jgi:hypothetical protein
VTSLLKTLSGFTSLHNNNNKKKTLSFEDCTSALSIGILIDFLLSNEHAKKSGVVLSNESAAKIATTTKVADEFRKAAENEIAKNKVTKNIDGVSGDAMYKVAMKKQQFSIKWVERNEYYNYTIKENTKFLKKIFDDEKLSKFLSIQDNILFIGNYKFTSVNFVLTKENKLKIFVTNSSGLVEINF